MSFDNVAKLKDVAHYKSVLKAELQKVQAKPVKFQYFDNFPFSDGKKPILVVGDFSTKLIDAIKDAGAAYKARGRCLEKDAELAFATDHGSLKDAALKLALKEVARKGSIVADLGSDEGRDEVLAEPQASGEVSHGRPALPAAAETAKARATLATAQKIFETIKAQYADKERADWTLRLTAIGALLDKGDLASAQRDLDKARDELEHKVVAMRAKAAPKLEAQGQVIDQAADARRRDEAALAKAQAALPGLQKQIEAAQASVAGLKSLPSGMKAKDWETRKASAAKNLKAAQDSAQERSDQIAELTRTLALDPEAVRKLHAAFIDLANRLKRTALDFEAELRRAGPAMAAADDPALKGAQDALAAPLGQAAQERNQVRAVLDKHRAALADLTQRMSGIEKQTQAAAGKALQAGARTALTHYRDTFRAFDAQPLRDTAFEKDLDVAAAPARAGIEAREKIFAELDQRKLAERCKALAQPSQKNNRALQDAKERLDDLLCAADIPASADLRKCLLLLAPLAGAEEKDFMKAWDDLVAEAVQWGTTAFAGNPLLREVWKKTCNSKGGDAGSIEGKTLEEVRTAIDLWEQLAGAAPGAASNLHVPGGGRPQWKQGKNVTRREVQANFISYWKGNEVNVHVGIVKCAQGAFYNGNTVNMPLIGQLIAAGQINDS